MLIRFTAVLALICASATAVAAKKVPHLDLETKPPRGMSVLPPFQRDGMWEKTVILERNGKRSRPIVKHTCILPSQVDQAERELFQPFPSECTGTQDLKGQEITWTYDCTGKTPMKGSGKLTFGKDEYSGTSESFAVLSPGEKLKAVKTTTEFKARRVDDCNAAPKSIFKDRNQR